MRKIFLLLALACPLAALADGLRLAMPYTDHCVLQRYQPIHVEGEARKGDVVTVSLGHATTVAKAGDDGHWIATLPPMKEAVGLALTVSSGVDTLRFNDVAIGEVWLASGQSNMAFMLSQTDEAREATAKADDPLLRFLDMKPRYQTTSRPWSEEARREVDEGRYYASSAWQPSTPQSAARMSAVAYYFARMMRDSLQVPVGIINNAIGGAPTEAWVDMGTLRAHAPEVLHDWTNNNLIQDWVRQRASENVGTDPMRQHPYKPGYLFMSGIEPLARYPVAGVLWYQGESNAHNTLLHERLFELLVSGWRSYWRHPALPFVFAQLSSIARPTWPEFRDSQRRLQNRIPNIGMAVTSDHGDSLDVHPHAKQPVGERMARWALHNVYNRADITPSGPLPESATASGGATVLLSFYYAKGLHASDGQPLRTFELAGYDGVFYPAEATIRNDVIEVTASLVSEPCFVRYGWQPFTRANLVNGDNLPASTFCLMIDKQNYGYAYGVSAPFAGIADGCVLVAGGCNFPENPLAKDSKKVFYDGIYRIDGDELVLVGSLPRPVAYGVSATTPGGIVMAGGTDNREAWLVAIDDGKAVVNPLPSLPCSIDNAAACAIQDKVYVAGGNTLLCFDGKEWKVLPAIPGNPRTQPVMASAPDAKGEMCLWLFGGFHAAGLESTLEMDGLVYIPSKKKWKPVAGPDVSVAGGCAATLPDGRIAVVGGVNRDIFLSALKSPAPDYLSHPVEWYRFNDRLLVFDPKTKTWSIVGESPDYARAGAVLIPSSNGSLLLYGGEIKPRIRTPRITEIKLR